MTITTVLFAPQYNYLIIIPRNLFGGVWRERRYCLFSLQQKIQLNYYFK